MKTKLRLSIVCIVIAILLSVSALCITTKQNIADALSENENLTFMLNDDGSGYQVLATDRTITSAIIPAEYNGLPVTEIADNAFMMCRSLEEVFIPSSVNRIGNNAFMNATKLKRIMGMAGVNTYGNNAFAMCSALDYLILPANILELGTSVIKNLNCTIYARASEAEMNSLNSDWNDNGKVEFGNGIVYQQYIDPVTKEIGYEIVEYQLLNPFTEDLVLNSWVESNHPDYPNAKLLNIAYGAFIGIDVPSITLKNYDGYSHSINIEPYAFAYTSTKKINIETNITLNANNTGYVKGDSVFLASTAEEITLPDSIDEISKEMFADCQKLTTIKNYSNGIIDNKLSDQILTISEKAFRNCYSLKKITVPNSIKHIDANAFFGWGTKGDQTISIEKFEEDSNSWNDNWNAGINTVHCNIIFTAAKELNVTFIFEQNDVINAPVTKTIVIERGQSLNTSALPEPESDSHTFSGIWYTNNLREEGTEYDLNKPVEGNLTLYAGWHIKVFEISFPVNKYCDFYDFNTGEIINNNSQFIEYGKLYVFYIKSNVGYSNLKLLYNGKLVEAVTSDAFTIKAYSSSSIVASADLDYYNIKYENLKNGTNPNKTKWATYTVEDNVELLPPEWRAYNEATWDITGWTPGTHTGDMTINAVWSNPTVFKINYANLRGGRNPNNFDTYTIEDNIKLINPNWEAYRDSSWSISGWDAGERWEDITVNANWNNPVTFRINYANIRKGTNLNKIISYTVEDNISFVNPIWDAYQNSAWDISGWLPDTYWGDKTITAIWSNPNTYTITYDLSNVTNVINNNTVESYTVEDTVKLVNPIGEGYTSLAWLKSGNIVTGWTKDTFWENIVITVKAEAKHFKIKFDLNGGSGNVPTGEIDIKYGDQLPVLSGKLTKDRYEFQSFKSKTTNKRYYNSSLGRLSVWDQANDDTLVAEWEQVIFSFIYDHRGGTGGEESFDYTGTYQFKETIKMPVRKGYVPKGYFFRYDIENYKVYNADGTYNYNNIVGTGSNRFVSGDITLRCVWEKDERTVNIVIDRIHAMEDKATVLRTFSNLMLDDTITFTADESYTYKEYSWDGKAITMQDTRLFTRWSMNLNGAQNAANSPWRVMTTERTFTYKVEDLINNYFPDYTYLPSPDAIYFRAIYVTSPPSCVAEGSYITLADGTQKKVEQLTGDEQLLVWNLQTGNFDIAPILFIDSDLSQEYEVIKLSFSDGTTVKVISEHAFWDYDLNKYVFLRADAAKYIGHWFNKQITNANGDMDWTKVQLIDVKLTTEVTTAWSPVTYGHLCYYVNGMLSMPGATESFINIFDVDADTMKINEEAFAKDIETYGLFTYEEFAEILPIPEVIFEAFGGQYLKVAIGKGLTTMEELATLIQRYEKFFN